LKRPRLIWFVLALLVILSIPPRQGLATSTSHLHTFFIDVGQGDSVLLHDDGNFDILIDGGQRSAGPKVAAFLRQQHIDDIDVMVATHADEDHIGGLIDVLQMTDVPIRAVIYNGYDGTTETWNDFLAAVHQEGLVPSPLQYPGAFKWGSVTGSVLNPEPGLINPDQDGASLVLLITHENVKYMFPADIGLTTESTLVARGMPLAAQVLKVAHHGSKGSSGTAFLSSVQPLDAIISVGTNSYGHPAPETLARLQAASARIWRTDQQGTIVVTDDGSDYRITYTQYLYLPMILRSLLP
jgi:beta-lactamase superfamily II metal-dependent hydrolase